MHVYGDDRNGDNCRKNGDNVLCANTERGPNSVCLLYSDYVRKFFFLFGANTNGAGGISVPLELVDYE